MHDHLSDLITTLRGEFPECDDATLLRMAMRLSIPAFALTCFPKTVPLAIPPIHYELYELLQSKEHEKAAIAMPRGCAKCVSGDTEILCADGTRKKISEIRSGEKIFSLNQKTLAFEEDSIAAKVYSGEKKAITITTKTMKEITCSPEHRILTYDGWKEASKITTSDRIASPRRTMFSDMAVSDYSDEEVKFLAYMIAEGSTTSGNCAFTNFDDEIRKDFMACCDSLGIKYSERLFGSLRLSGSARQIIRKHGIENKLATQKRLPSFFYVLPERQKWIIVGALIDTDGYVSKDGDLGITLANNELVKDIQVLLWSVGVNSRVSKHTENGKSGYTRLYIDRESYITIEEYCPFVLKGKRLHNALSVFRYSLIDLYPNSVKRLASVPGIAFRNLGVRIDNKYETTRDKMRRMIAVDPVEEWVRLENASVFWDSVISIVDNDESVDMYDIQVAKNENAIMNGLVAHNSTVTDFLYVLWEVLHKTDTKDLFITIISESQSQSINFLSRIKNALNKNPKIRRYYGDFGVNTAIRWREDDITLKNGARIVALGTGQKVRGLIQDDTRVNIIILDDFESESNARTPEARLGNRKWIMEAVLPSLSQTDGRIICIGTTISEDCFLQWVKDAPDWHVIWKSILNEDGESLWPEMYPLHRIEQIRQGFEHMGNLSGFFQEYMNQPQSPDDAPFKPDYMRSYTGDLEEIDGRWWLDFDGKKRLLNLFMGVDLASSLGLRADYTVLATVAKDAFGNEYLIDVEKSKSNPAEHPDMIIKAFKKWHHQGVYIESVAYQESCRQHVRAKMVEEGVHIPGIERKITHRNSKSERLISLVPLLAQGRFYFRGGDLEAQREFLAFPKGKNDDLLDAIWLASNYGYKPIQKDTEAKGESLKKRIGKKLGWMVA